jgi:hypothetical protein
MATNLDAFNSLILALRRLNHACCIALEHSSEQQRCTVPSKVFPQARQPICIGLLALCNAKRKCV